MVGLTVIGVAGQYGWMEWKDFQWKLKRLEEKHETLEEKVAKGAESLRTIERRYGSGK